MVIHITTRAVLANTMQLPSLSIIHTHAHTHACMHACTHTHTHIHTHTHTHTPHAISHTHIQTHTHTHALTHAARSLSLSCFFLSLFFFLELAKKYNSQYIWLLILFLVYMLIFSVNIPDITGKCQPWHCAGILVKAVLFDSWQRQV